MEQLKENQNPLETEPISRLIFKYSVPTALTLMVNYLYNIVDQMFVGQGVGITGMAATNVAFPLTIIATALGLLIGDGGAANISLCLGRKEQETADKIASHAVTMLVLCGAALWLVCSLFAPGIVQLFGATETAFRDSLMYTRTIAWGLPFLMLCTSLTAIIRADGNPQYTMKCMMAGAVINIVLDPIFIFGLHMGVRGAALATITAQGVSAIWVLRFLTGRRTKLRLQRRYFRIKPSVLAPVLALGVSPFIMQSTESLVNISFNSSLRTYGGDPAVGAMTICSSIMQVFSMLFQGLSQGAQPIIGFNFGAGNLDRVKKTFRLLFISSLIFSCSVWAAIQLFPGLFVSLFNDKPELVEIAVWTLRVYVACMFMMGIQFSCQQTFVALGEAKISLFLALLRKIILLIPLIYILPHILPGNQVFAVFLAEPIADFLAASTTGLIFLWRFPRILTRRRQILGPQQP